MDNKNTTSTAKVLYVEDDPGIQELIKQIFSLRTNVELEVTASGRSALKFAKNEKPDIIFLDQHLGDMRGEEVLKNLKQDKETQGIDVVMVTGDSGPQVQKEVAFLGARECIVKPFKIPTLLNALQEVLVEKHLTVR